jgi:cupin fold WbuC family metalloprotein
MRAITQVEIEQLIWQAKKPDRKRAILRLHEDEELMQRMVNAVVPGTYVQPHKHEDPDKVELFSILKGKVAVLKFNNIGEVEAVLDLDEHGPIKIVEIPPRTYHSIVALQPSALLELIDGPYVEATHKQMASWAPTENSPKANDYLIYMTSIVHNWQVKQNL